MDPGSLRDGSEDGPFLIGGFSAPHIRAGGPVARRQSLDPRWVSSFAARTSPPAGQPPEPPRDDDRRGPQAPPLRRRRPARLSHHCHGLRGAVRPTGQERRAARCGASGKRLDAPCRPESAALRVAPRRPPPSCALRASRATSRASTVVPATPFGPLLTDRTPGRDADRDNGEKSGLEGAMPVPQAMVRYGARRSVGDGGEAGRSAGPALPPGPHPAPPACERQGDQPGQRVAPGDGRHGIRPLLVPVRPIPITNAPMTPLDPFDDRRRAGLWRGPPPAVPVAARPPVG